MGEKCAILKCKGVVAAPLLKMRLCCGGLVTAERGTPNCPACK